MSINLLPGANQLAAKQEILAKLNEDAKRFPYGLKYKIVLDNSKFVAASVKNVTDTMIIAFILVAIIILLFLNNWLKYRLSINNKCWVNSQFPIQINL
jgi:HAE1 family hydrophobic/amphiphilic exporter-1